MKNFVLATMLLVAHVAAPQLAAAEASPDDVRNLLKGVSGEFSSALTSGEGFSFRYDGKRIGPVMPADWTSSAPENTQVKASEKVQANAPTLKYTKTFRHPSGLVIVREARVFKRYDAIEYRLVFRNTADKPLPTLTEIEALRLGFAPPLAEGNCVISSYGGEADSYFPPRNWTLRESCLNAGRAGGMSMIDISSMGGRSSNGDMPFFFVHNAAKREGLFVAFGWSGEWRAMARTDGANTTALQLRGMVPDLEISLNPGEEITGPTVLVGFYRGSPFDGTNRLRRLIRDEYTPKLDGATMSPVATFDALTLLQKGAGSSEALMKKSIDNAAATGQEYFLLDAGWYEGDDFNLAVGNWEGIDRKRLPNGLAPMADYARSKGLKFGLWYETERVGAGTWIAVHHPDWVLWDSGADYAPAYAHARWALNFRPDDYPAGKFGLLDYGNPEVQRYIRDLFDRQIREFGIKYIRYDFNIDPLPYWRATDTPGRRGIRQIRHIEGLYAILDWVREHHPDTIIENCASGGRRIDLEMLKRSHTAWISDQWTESNIARHHLQGINRLLPGNYAYVYFVLPQVADQGPEKLDDLAAQSRFGGAFGAGDMFDPGRWTPAIQSGLRRHVEVWKTLRRYLIEDYYPVGEEQPRSLKSWSGWQFHDPNDQSGFIQTFRTNASDAKHRFAVHGLKSDARYRFTDVYSSQSFEVTGAVAMTEGIEFAQAPMSSKVLTYRQTSKP